MAPLGNRQADGTRTNDHNTTPRLHIGNTHRVNAYREGFHQRRSLQIQTIGQAHALPTPCRHILRETTLVVHPGYLLFFAFKKATRCTGQTSAAGDKRQRTNTISHFPVPLCLRADLGDFSNVFMSENLATASGGQPLSSGVEVCATNAAVAHFQHKFRGIRRGIVDDLNVKGFAYFLKNCSLHQRTSR